MISGRRIKPIISLGANMKSKVEKSTAEYSNRSHTKQCGSCSMYHKEVVESLVHKSEHNAQKE